jgi:hypothetical protein
VCGSNMAKFEGEFSSTSYDASRYLIRDTYIVKALNVRGSFRF